MRKAIVVLSVLVAIALLGLSAASAAEELWVIKDGVLDKKALTPGSTSSGKGHVYCGGQTVDGLHVSTPQAGGRANYARFTTAKSALGDCEFKVVFSCAAGRPGWRFPSITISNRGSFCFWKPGSPVLLSNRKTVLPLKAFSAPTEKNPFDGKLHSMAVKRVGDKISFYYDDKKVNEQPIDPDVNLHLWFDALRTTIKVKSIKLTAEKLYDEVRTVFHANDPAKAELLRYATFPVPVQGGWWRKRHDANVARMNQGGCDLLMIGDSITHGFESTGRAVWDKYYAPRKAMNLGFSGDQTQHVLWRLDHLPTGKISPKAAVVMIGTNNVGKRMAAKDVALGVRKVALKLGSAWPKMKILVLAVFPRDARPDGALRRKVAAVNALLPDALKDVANVTLLDIGARFLDDKGGLSPQVMPDGLHPNARGYEIWAAALEPELAKMVGGLPGAGTKDGRGGTGK